MTAVGCICVVRMELDSSAICSTSCTYVSRPPLASRKSGSHARVGLFLRGVVRKGAGMEDDGLARGWEIEETAVSSCSASSLAVVEFDTLSIDRRDIISSRVDAFIGRTEKSEESAFARRLEVTFVPLEDVERVIAGEWERELERGVDNIGIERALGGALALDDGGGKKERLAEGTLRTTGGASKLRGSGWEGAISALSSPPGPCCTNNEVTASSLV